MGEVTDAVKIREWVDPDADPDEWPPPTEYAEFRVEGQMRADVLAKIGRPADSDAVVRMIHIDSEGGYSEWTVEYWFGIEIWVDEDRQSQRVFDHESEDDDQLPALLKWLDQ